MTNRKPNGYLLHENAMYVVIATMETANPKTGNMVQLWILPRNTSPVDAVRTGEDDIVCFDCKHRGVGGKNRTCYVKVFQAPTAVWKAYRRGSYPTLAIEDYKYTFAGRKIRFGAYGEPVLIPLHIFRELAIYSDGWTGYTHQWANPEYLPYQAYVMASVDSPAEYEWAKSLGWRTFRVRTSEQPLAAREIICPASDEANHKTTCEDCRLCSGSYASDPRKDIAIIVHGSAASKFIQIGA
jgi:hypothetical protein